MAEIKRRRRFRIKAQKVEQVEQAKKPVKKQPRLIMAADLLDSKHPHPLRGMFVAWVRAKGVEATKRQARRFLQAHPNYNQIKAA